MSESSSSQYRKRRRRGGPSWKNLPAFLDASASVSAGTFGARRLVELEKLYQQHHQQNKQVPKNAVPSLQSGGGKTSRRHLRRRTTAHKTRKHVYRPSSKTGLTSQLRSRKARRGRQPTLCDGHYQWQQEPPSTRSSNNEPEEQKTSLPTAQWITTHLWHAKRFHMETLWGWRIPLAHTNRGARAVLRLVGQEKRSSLQDITWKRQALVVSSTQSFTVLAQALSRVCPELFSNNPAALTCGSQMTKGMVHHTDQFPSKAIGPSWFHILRRKDRWIVQCFMHPSIRSTVSSCLEELIRSSSGAIVFSEPAESNCCCFRICGETASQIIQHALHPIAAPHLNPWEWSWESIQDVMKDYATTNANTNTNTGSSRADVLPHGSVVSVLVHLRGDTTKDAISSTTHSADNIGYLPKVQEAMEAWNPNNPNNIHHKGLLFSPDDAKRLVLVRQSPRPLDCTANHAVVGWDLFCPSALAKDVWKALCQNCVAIGMVEASHLIMDCQQPIPLFPRDFIDTHQSALYWNGMDPAWSFVRKLYEAGWGRLGITKLETKQKTSPHQQTPKRQINWGSLMLDGKGKSEAELEGTSDSDCNIAAIVVRGSFGQPFVDALRGCGGHLPPANLNDANISCPCPPRKRRRNRRPSRPRNAVICADSLSNRQRLVWGQTCCNLLESLSLPAVLNCCLLVHGKGTIEPGSKILASRNSMLLGFTTAGTFSLARGAGHGMGVVAAALLLKSLSEAVTSNADQQQSGRIVRLANNTREMQLLVTVSTGSNECVATMSLIY